MILVMGLKKTGQSITDYLTKQNRPYSVYDRKEEVLYRYEIMGVKTYRDDEIIDDPSIDLVIKSPGIPPYEEHIKYFKERGVKIISDIEFFYTELMPKKVIAITGTNGKTTTTEMISELLKKEVPITAGNIGMAIFNGNRSQDDIYVFELSSFQLEDTHKFRPNVAVLLNVEEDHLDWHGSFENYKKAKYKIFENQTSDDALIICADTINENEIHTKSKVYKYSVIKKDGMNAYIDNGKIVINRDDFCVTIPMEKLKYKEMHNIGNMMAAILAASFYGIDAETIDDFLENFRLDFHRVQTVGFYKGVKFIDDSKATNPSATVSALINMPEETILLLGGFDKQTDFTDPITLAGRKIKKMIFFGDIKEKLKNTSDLLSVTNYIMATNMKDAFNKAVELSENGDTILLSPGASSFDEFKSYEERGEYFKKLLQDLKDGEK